MESDTNQHLATGAHHRRYTASDDHAANTTQDDYNAFAERIILHDSHMQSVFKCSTIHTIQVKTFLANMPSI